MTNSIRKGKDMRTTLREDLLNKLIGLKAGEHYVYYTNQPKPPTASEPIYRRDQWKFDTIMEAYELGYGVPVQYLVDRFHPHTNEPWGQYNYVFIRNGRK